jgi:hypothetical protein
MKKVALALLLTAVVVGSGLGSCFAAQETAAEKRQLFMTGARLWPIYCNQCHNARPGSEFAPYQWDQIIMHMQALPNMPPKDARAILEYLKGGRE